MKPVWILVENVVHNYLGHEDWGLYTAMFALGFLFVTLADFGTNAFTAKQLASDPGKLQHYYPTLLGMRLVMAMAFPLLMITIGKYVFLFNDKHLYFLFLASLVHAAAQMLQFFRSYVQAFQKFNLDAFASVADRALLLIFTGGLFWWGLSLESFAWARILSTGLAAIGLFLLVHRFSGKLRPAFERAISLDILRLSLPFALYTVVYAVHDKVDQVMLERMIGEHETGLYVGAYRWMDALSMYLWTVLPIFFARFAFHLHDYKEQEKLVRFGQMVLAFPLILGGLFIIFYGNTLLFLFTNSTASELETIRECLRALGVALILNSITSIISTLLTATGFERQVNRMALASVVLNVTLNALVIPRFGAVGSAWTTVASYAFLDILYVTYAARKLPIELPWVQMLRLVALALAGGVVYQYAHVNGWQWWTALSVTSLILVAGAWSWGMFKNLGLSRHES